MNTHETAESGLARDVTLRGYRLHYVESGAGKPLILVGGSMSTHAYWSPVVPALAAKCRVLAIDYIGSGASDKPPSGFGYSVHDQADVIAEMVRELGLGRVNLAGVSYGGVIVLSFATRYPELTDRVVSIEGGVVKLEKYPPNPVEGLLRIPLAGDLFLWLAALGMFNAMFLKLVAGAWYPEMTAADKADVMGHLLAFFRSTTRAAWYKILSSYRTREDFHEQAKTQLKAPVLYLWGGRSSFGNVLVKRNLEFFTEYLPNVRAVGFDDGIHDLTNQKPAAVSKLILDFIDEDFATGDA